MDFRLHFESQERDKCADGIDKLIRGEMSDAGPLFLENHKQDELDEREGTYRDKTLAVPNNALVRQAWLYAAALARDARYSRYRRTRLKASALNSLYMENYGVGKVAFDSKHSSK
jgi:hypothetical protein